MTEDQRKQWEHEAQVLEDGGDFGGLVYDEFQALQQRLDKLEVLVRNIEDGMQRLLKGVTQ